MKGKIDFGHMTESDENIFYSSLESLEGKIRSAFVNTGVEDAGEIFDSSLNLVEIMKSLPSNQRNAFMNEYAEIINFKATLKDAGAGGVKSYTTGRDRSMGKFSVEMGDPINGKLNPKAVIYNRMTLNQHYITKDWNPGSNILRSGFLKQIANPVQMETGKKMLVLDTETAGLGMGNVREIAAYQMGTKTLEDGTVTIASPTKATFHAHLKTTPMKLGALFNDKTGAVQTLPEVLRSQIGFQFEDGVTGSGEVFAKQMKTFLGQVLDSDYIGGQNLQFDIGQIFNGAKSTSVYKNDSSFRKLVKDAEAHISGRIVDTLELARVKLPGLDIAPEVMFGNSYTSHSMENVMLQTNLTHLISEEMGEEAFKDMLGVKSGINAIHSANVDVKVESYFAKFLFEDKIRALNGNERVNSSVRAAILRSSAPTPVTNASDIAQVPTEISRRLYEAGGIIEIMEEDVNAEHGFRVVDAKDKYGSYQGMMKGLASDDTVYRIGVNAVEVRSLTERDLGLASDINPSTKAMLPNGNLFAGYAGADISGQGFLNVGGEISRKGNIASLPEYGAFQKHAASLGDINAGLSLPERIMTEGMQRATMMDKEVIHRMGVAQAEASSLMGDLGISRFELFKEAHASSRSASVTLPVSVLEAAESSINAGSSGPGLNITGRVANSDGTKIGLEMARVSAFQDMGGKYHANLAIDLSREHVKGVQDYLMGIGEQDRAKLLGVSENKAGAVMAGIDNMLRNGMTVGGKHAINIGQVSGAAAEAVHAVIAPFSNSTQISNDATEMTMRAAYGGSENGVANLGAFVVDKGMKEGERIQYADNVRRALERQNQVIDMTGTGSYRSAQAINSRRTSLGRAGVKMSKQQAESTSRLMGAISETTNKLPLAGVAVAGALMLKMGYSSLKERRQLSETFDFQGHEGSNDYYNIQQQVESQRNAARYMDPLSTAGLVGNLRNNAYGSSLMGPNKNNNLFSGAI